MFDDLLYLYYILKYNDMNHVLMALLMTNVTNLISICKNEDNLNAIITLVGQKTSITDRDKFGKEK